MAKYLLSIEEFMDKESGEALLGRAFLYVDEERERKARRMRPGLAQAASLGAGLLLQLGVREAMAEAGPEFAVQAMTAGVQLEGQNASRIIKRYSAKQLIESLCGKPPIPLAYVYGKEGKPYVRDLPFYFNLSHSGSYVLCAISGVEIGVDIQQHSGKDVGKLARRFFPERECAALEQAGEERERLFYRLWARKEAYGKLTGKGIADALGVNLLPGAALPEKAVFTALPEGRCLVWEESDVLKEYSIAFCRYG